MIKYFFILLTLIFIPAPLMAQQQAENAEAFVAPEAMPAVVRVYDKVVKHQIPKGWKPAFQNEQPGHFIMEFVPKGESVKKWNSMFTLQGFKGIGQKIQAKDLLTLTAKQQQQVCPKSFVFETLKAEKISGLPTDAAIAGCADLPIDIDAIGLKKGMSEIGYYIAVQSGADIYLFHKSIRGEGFSKDAPPITQDNATDFIGEFMPIELIDPLPTTP